MEIGLLVLYIFFIDMFGLADILGTPTYIATFWYMSLAQIIIFLVPLFIIIYKRGGVLY